MRSVATCAEQRRVGEGLGEGNPLELCASVGTRNPARYHRDGVWVSTSFWLPSGPVGPTRSSCNASTSSCLTSSGDVIRPAPSVMRFHRQVVVDRPGHARRGPTARARVRSTCEVSAPEVLSTAAPSNTGRRVCCSVPAGAIRHVRSTYQRTGSGRGVALRRAERRIFPASEGMADFVPERADAPTFDSAHFSVKLAF